MENCRSPYEVVLFGPVSDIRLSSTAPKSAGPWNGKDNRRSRYSPCRHVNWGRSELQSKMDYYGTNTHLYFAGEASKSPSGYRLQHWRRKLNPTVVVQRTKNETDGFDTARSDIDIDMTIAIGHKLIVLPFLLLFHDVFKLLPKTH
ncbi:unnamed protein product [Haemonchus placei]|uniref:Uncharacterized protein n=1 Tax=Haemonchus placei TaxID=6290 RepID=A0A0N4WDJ0_HAEPC|nr:unnamed protein product [Haemonchus placei]